MAGTHRWNGKKTRAGRERCSRCGILREAYTALIRKPIVTSKGVKKGTKPVRVKAYNYYRGNKPIIRNWFDYKAPACEKEESSDN